MPATRLFAIGQVGAAVCVGLEAAPQEAPAKLDDTQTITRDGAGPYGMGRTECLADVSPLRSLLHRSGLIITNQPDFPCGFNLDEFVMQLFCLCGVGPCGDKRFFSDIGSVPGNALPCDV